MPRPRRAASPPPRRLWPLSVAVAVAVVLVGLVLAPGLRDSVPSAPPPGAASPHPTETRPSPVAPARTSSPDQGAARALRACRKKVAAGDKVLAAASRGIRHWTQHVEAQTEADAGRISVAQMNAVFRRTRLAGPEDVREYDRAERALRASKGSCEKRADAGGQVAKRLAACAERRRAQVPVLAAAKDGMSDWKRHLSDMRRADQAKIAHPAERWRQMYAAAPARIRAYQRAVDDFDPPKCRPA